MLVPENRGKKNRTVASCIGLMVASFVAVLLGPLYYRILEKNKNRAKTEQNKQTELGKEDVGLRRIKK